MHFSCRHNITQQKYQNWHFEREKGSLNFSSIKLIFTPSASDNLPLFQKGALSKQMEFISGKKLPAITCSHLIATMRMRKTE